MIEAARLDRMLSVRTAQRDAAAFGNVAYASKAFDGDGAGRDERIVLPTVESQIERVGPKRPRDVAKRKIGEQRRSVEYGTDRARFCEMRDIAREPIGNVDRGVRDRRHRATRQHESARCAPRVDRDAQVRILESSGPESAQARGGEAHATGDPQSVAGTRAAPEHRGFAPAEEGRCDREGRSPRQVSADERRSDGVRRGPLPARETLERVVVDVVRDHESR